MPQDRDDLPRTAREFIARQEARETQKRLEDQLVVAGHTTREKLDADKAEIARELFEAVGFIVKDSGERQQFDSGMQRDTTTGKVRYDLCFDGPMFERLAVHLTKGAVKYDARNWMKAAGTAEMERFKESAIRHFVQWMRGDTDEDHAAAVMFNINGYEYVRDRLDKPA